MPLTDNNTLLVAMHTVGIALFDLNQKKFVQWIKYDTAVKSGGATDFNSSIYCYKNVVIWICTWKGLTKINTLEQLFQSDEYGYLQSATDYNLISSITDDPYNKNFFWWGINGGGINFRPLLASETVFEYNRLLIQIFADGLLKGGIIQKVMEKNNKIVISAEFLQSGNSEIKIATRSGR
jgi:hypothetical protein